MRPNPSLNWALYSSSRPGRHFILPGYVTLSYAAYSNVSPVTPMLALEDLLVNAFAKFLAAGLSIDRARFGLFGIWVVNEEGKPQPTSETQLACAIACRDTWPNYLSDFSNPYEELAAFYGAGASLGRWENKILDVFDTNGEKVSGIPLQSLVEAANNSIHRTCAKKAAQSGDFSH